MKNFYLKGQDTLNIFLILYPFIIYELIDGHLPEPLSGGGHGGISINFNDVFLPNILLVIPLVGIFNLILNRNFRINKIFAYIIMISCIFVYLITVCLFSFILARGFLSFIICLIIGLVLTLKYLYVPIKKGNTIQYQYFMGTLFILFLSSILVLIGIGPSIKLIIISFIYIIIGLYLCYVKDKRPIKNKDHQLGVYSVVSTILIFVICFIWLGILNDDTLGLIVNCSLLLIVGLSCLDFGVGLLQKNKEIKLKENDISTDSLIQKN